MRELYLKYKNYRVRWENYEGFISGYCDEFLIMSVDGKGDPGWRVNYLDPQLIPTIKCIKPSRYGYMFVFESDIVGPPNGFKFGK